MKPLHRNVLLAVVIVVIIATITYLETSKPKQAPVTTVLQTLTEQEASTTATTGADAAGETGAASSTGGGLSPAAFLASRATTVAEEGAQYPSAPEITDPSGWINTQPFTLSSLVGNKVVLLDFWTYSCINCIRTIPYLNAWYAKYKDYGLEIVGIHTPEFQFEHDLSNVQMAVKSLGIQYPVVLDNDMGTWDAYQNLYWPNEYLINIDGFIVHNQVGEGDYAATEAAIQAALTQRDQALGLPDNVPTGTVNPSSTIAIDYNDVQSPETYFGAERNGYLANGIQLTPGVQTLTAPAASTVQMNALYLGGTWDFENQYAQNQTAGATITYEYDAKNVYMVASSANASQPVTLTILRDGQPLGAAAGADVSSSSTMTVQANRLYNIVNDPAGYGEHTLTITAQSPGLQAYTFTFG